MQTFRLYGEHFMTVGGAAPDVELRNVLDPWSSLEESSVASQK